MAVKKNVKDIHVCDKLLLSDTSFEYVVDAVLDKALLIQMNGEDLWLPKSLIDVMSSLLSVQGYRRFNIKRLPEWFVKKNNIH